MSASDERQPEESKVTVYTYDYGTRLTEVRELTGEAYRELQERIAACPDPAPPPFRFEHDPEARVFRLTAPDGSVEVFRDNPTRFLCVEPDPQTGAMRAVTKYGRPVYLYLCREEREVK